ncbi:DegT/DnrJ/EryC1/StrS family aminotransferase [Sulfurospirillum arcachonense]|uniref:DegT/DnrJ/EryC1/StrS family aminotransferase n=1 Tax=Sulfurospirillum arcachonense TaxID=57666 RepID=UPI00046ACF6F|nr:DegT/DnrJ/EryC1/StrS family aminotransferase [Sulfurospirillum arcachonense]
MKINFANLQYQYNLYKNELQVTLKEQGIPTVVHYPMPLHLQESFSYMGYNKGDFPISEIVPKEMMSLPMNPYVINEVIEYIVENLK